MRPIIEIPPAVMRGIRFVLCDVDDTLTTGGRLTAAAYGAMESLQRSAVKVIAVTGRPAGWCDHIARMWPVDGVVGENGAFYFHYDHAERKMTKRYIQDVEQRAADRARLAAIRDRILREVPGCAVASDQNYREADLAIDYCEDVPRLPPAAVDTIVSLMQQAGLTAKVSSIHVNGWFGNYNKLAMTATLLRERFDFDIGAHKNELIFIGDSPNDAPMFEYFPHSVGVANVRSCASRLSATPAYVTMAESGAGFCELVRLLIAAR